MKKLIAMGVLALAISVSANAKTVTKVKSLFKSKHHAKTNICLFSCVGGITSCGTSYMHCDNSKDFPTAEELYEIWEFEDHWACG